MATVHGSTAHLTVNAVDLSAWVDTSSLSYSGATHETTTYGKTHVTRKGGLKDWTITCGGLFDAAAAGPDPTLAPLVGGAPVPVVWGPEGNTTGDTRYTGTAIVESYEPSAPVGDMVRWTATLRGSDTLTRDTFV